MKVGGMQHAFNLGDRVFCFEPDTKRVCALYEAKIASLTSCKVNGERVPAYKVTFNNWNAIYRDRRKRWNYERKIKESCLLRVNQRHERLLKRLQKEAVIIQNEKKRRKRLVEMLLAAHEDKLLKFLPPVLTEGHPSYDVVLSSEEDDSGNDDRDTEIGETETTVVGDTELEQAAEDNEPVEIEIPEALMKILEWDHHNVKVKHRLIDKASDLNVVHILEMFFQHYASTLLDDRSKNSKDIYKPEQRITLTKEVLEGTRLLFDFLLPRVLLYNEEQSGYNSLIINRTSRLDDSQRVSAREAASGLGTQHISSSDDSKTSARVCVNTHGSADPITAPAVKKAFRLSNPLQMVLQGPSSGRSTPVNHPTADILMREVNDWRLLPDEVYHGPPLPCTVYGANHLLRIFVKLGEVLTIMKLPRDKKEFLLSVFSALLSFLSEEKDKMFDVSLTQVG